MYRRGIPFSPIKCWGKKVRLAEMIMLMKLTVSHLLLKFIEVNSLSQKIILEMMEKITPIERT